MRAAFVAHRIIFQSTSDVVPTLRGYGVWGVYF
jgi:hypothetical protein